MAVKFNYVYELLHEHEDMHTKPNSILWWLHANDG